MTDRTIDPETALLILQNPAAPYDGFKARKRELVARLEEAVGEGDNRGAANLLVEIHATELRKMHAADLLQADVTAALRAGARALIAPLEKAVAEDEAQEPEGTTEAEADNAAEHAEGAPQASNRPASKKAAKKASKKG